MMRLTARARLPGSVTAPRYDPDATGTGIVHIGLGAFHKAHQAVFTDDALGAGGGDWRITGVSLRSTQAADALTPQGGRYTVIERGADGTTARVVGAIAGALSLTRDRPAVMAALCDPATRIVSLTVTEKAYGLDPATGRMDPEHPAIAADLADPEVPQGVAGLLVRALGLRRAAGIAPFTVLSCDNLPDNGRLLHGLLQDFAERVAPDLARFIEAEVACPSTMVDRITPAATAETRAMAERLTGFQDLAAVETETFRQWVIEDRFPTGRPVWEAGGALLVQDVHPYEQMKLRMLNGAHSMLAYAGHVAGIATVRDAMDDPALSRLVARHLSAAAATLDATPGADLPAYAAALMDRFRNPHLRHETYQIAMDGSQKMPLRIFDTAQEALARGQPLAPFVFAAAAWMRYTLGRTDGGAGYDLRDPIAAALTTRPGDDAAALYDRIWAIPGILPERLCAAPTWRVEVIARLDLMMREGMRAAMDAEVRGLP